MSLRVQTVIAFCVALITSGPPAAAAGGERAPVDITDPLVGEILFHFYQDDYLPAIARLRATRQQGRLDDQVAWSELLLGDMLLADGQHLGAADVFEHVPVDITDRETRDRAWLALAKSWHRRGDLHRAQEALHHMSGSLADDLSGEASVLQAQIYIENGQYDRAIALLQAWDGTSVWASYARYNLSVALLRDGQADAAAQNLDAVGRIEPVNEELSALRDKANLALGYSLLRDEQPQPARAALQRVRAEGPFSNKALLGLGWADARLGNYESALVPWQTLRDRDLSDPAVLESMLAIPYAQARLDLIDQAVNNYRGAIEVFDEETDRIDRVIGLIESDERFDQFLAAGHLNSTGSAWQFEAASQMPETRYMIETLATHEFHEGLKSYREMASHHRGLESWQQDVDVYASVIVSQQKPLAPQLREAEKALREADLNNILSRQQRFAGVLDNIERFNDWLALANEQEFDSWRRISSLQASPALATNSTEAEQARQKIRWLKGVMQWDLERKADERLRGAVRDLRDVGDVLTEAQAVRDQIERNMRVLPERYAALGEKADELAQRIEATKMRIEDSLVAQRALLRSIAVGELSAQKARLTSYTLQARLALATIYESPARGGD